LVFKDAHLSRLERCLIIRRRRLISTFSLQLALFFSLVVLPNQIYPATISGTVKDPSGAVVPQARIEITGGDLTEPTVLVTDSVGKFTVPDLKPGKYVLRVTKEGFETLEKTVDAAETAALELTLSIAAAQTRIEVPARALPNADPVYRTLRSVGMGQTFRFDNFSLACDVATLRFEKGTLTWLQPVEGLVTGAVFVGSGHFHLKPATDLDETEIERRIGSKVVDEDFTEIVFRFTGEEHDRFLKGLGEQLEPSSEAAVVFQRWKEHMRQRREIPTSITEAFLQGERIDNVDADVLAGVYNHAHPPFLDAYLHGKKHKDLRFLVRTRVGAMPELDSPEEVALINFDPGGMEDGVWYLAHLKSEYAARTANSLEDRRLFATVGYKIETVIAKNKHLFSTATVTFKPLIAGERILKFGLLPNLRVSRVLDDKGQSLNFVQESRKEDGSFYGILSKAVDAGSNSSVTIEYAGDKVLEEAGEGSFYVRARTSWYPNLNGFGEYANYDLTFKVPHRFKVISVGKLVSETTEQDLAVSHWVTPIPVAVAGFNYGDYKKVEITDDITHYKISGYYLSELPDNLRRYSALQSMAPGSMTKYALDQTRAQLQVCTAFFGKSPYEDVYITEQPDFAFGQSWPDLIYLPISAYTDSTQRWMLFGQINSKFSGFVQEVTPHEVAHQWWGHTVGWASYHDQWLSEGFAEFSAALFLQNAVGPKWQKDYVDFWERLRERTLEKNNFGIAPNDAGPIWMGLRLISPRTETGYQNVTYPKGAYILEMLRSIMYSQEDGDKEFIALMHDFVDTYRGKLASTESFKAVADKHITKMTDLTGNHRLDWFFREWVYGTQAPKYNFEYQLTPADGGKTKLHMTITQSDVDSNFAMLVPIFADFGKGWARIGQVGVVGNAPRSAETILPMVPKKVGLNVYKEILER
jgi:hypothetical protein